jgi:hypothetical protein
MSPYVKPLTLFIIPGAVLFASDLNRESQVKRGQYEERRADTYTYVIGSVEEIL